MVTKSPGHLAVNCARSGGLERGGETVGVDASLAWLGRTAHILLGFLALGSYTTHSH